MNKPLISRHSLNFLLKEFQCECNWKRQILILFFLCSFVRFYRRSFVRATSATRQSNCHRRRSAHSASPNERMNLKPWQSFFSSFFFLLTNKQNRNDFKCKQFSIQFKCICELRCGTALTESAVATSNALAERKIPFAIAHSRVF